MCQAGQAEVQGLCWVQLQLGQLGVNNFGKPLLTCLQPAGEINASAFHGMDEENARRQRKGETSFQQK